MLNSVGNYQGVQQNIRLTYGQRVSEHYNEDIEEVNTKIKADPAYQPGDTITNEPTLENIYKTILKKFHTPPKGQTNI